MTSLWKALPKPFFALAPMEDVTDTVFRQIVTSCAKPDVFFTEFCNCDGLQSVGRTRVDHRLKYTMDQHPIVAQVWGIHPENYYKTAKEIVEMGFDGIDINMGCPERSVVGHGACSALIKNPNLAKEIIQATKEGAAGAIAVSVKTRIGYSKIITDEWISFLLSLGLDALTVHGRTTAEMSSVPCHWDEIKKAVAIRNSLGMTTRIIGNGDVVDRKDGLRKVQECGVDGIMIGRGIFNDLWAFEQKLPKPVHSHMEHIQIMKHHIEFFESTWGQKKHYPILKKFFKVYVRGFDGASDWRAKCMLTESPSEVYPILDEMLASFPES